jgi:hypothetical protein
MTSLNNGSANTKYTITIMKISPNCDINYDTKQACRRDITLFIVMTTFCQTYYYIRTHQPALGLRGMARSPYV